MILLTAYLVLGVALTAQQHLSEQPEPSEPDGREPTPATSPVESVLTKAQEVGEALAAVIAPTDVPDDDDDYTSFFDEAGPTPEQPTHQSTDDPYTSFLDEVEADDDVYTSFLEH